MNNSLVNILNKSCKDKLNIILDAVKLAENELQRIVATGRYQSSLSAPEFTKDQLDSTDWCGYKDFTDADKFRGLSLIPNVQSHHSLYGISQGRDILEKIETTKISKVVLIAPSYGKQCGIGEYGRYLESCFKNIGKHAYSFRTSEELVNQSEHFLKDALVLVNHGPGLFDGLNPKLGQGESTHQLLQNLLKLRDSGALPAILMHSLIDTDQDLLYSRQQMILNSEIPAITFITDASRNFYIPQVELGVSPVKKPKSANKDRGERSTRQEVIGFFGFFQYGGKDFDALFHMVRSLRAKLTGSVATSNSDELDKFTHLLDSSDIPHELGSGWVSDKELAERLSKADYFYLPQNDYDYWNNSATARFVMNLDRPVFLPPHQPFLDVEEGAVFATTEDLPRIVSHYRQENEYTKAVKKSADFRKKADMKNTAKKLLSGVFSEFKEKSTESFVSANDTSLQRFLALSPERKILYLNTFGIHESYNPDNLANLISNGVFSSVYKSVNKISFWRKHYNVDDFVHSSLLESVHCVYQNVCKRHIELAELTTICRYKKESKGKATAGALMSHALKNALSHRGFRRRFHNPELAIYSNYISANEGHISPDSFENLITQNLQHQKEIDALPLTEITYRPHINNVLEMIVQPISEINRRSYSIDLSVFDMEAILSSNNLYKRYNDFLTECTKNGVDIVEQAIVDQPVVREVEYNRFHYSLEDLYFHDDDLFVLNAVRCLFKRDPFPIESFTLRNMLDTLGKKDVLTYLSANRSNRAFLSFENISLVETLEEDFTRFAAVMRDPVSGGIEMRNRYCVEKRNNYRVWLSTKEALEGYLQQINNDSHALYSLYYHLCNSESDFNLADTVVPEEGKIENWLMVDGTFMNSGKLEKSMLTLKPEVALNINNISVVNKDSLINFHKIEADGAWSNTGSSHLMFSMNDDDVDHETYEYSVSVRLRSYGSKMVPGRQVRVSVVSNQPDAEKIEAKGVLADDATKLFSLPLNNAAGAAYHLVQFYISSVTNPAVLEGSPDNRDLGLMVQQVTIHRVAKQIKSNSEEKSDVEKHVA